MSISNPRGTTIPNPAQKFIEWAGKDGVFRYWDKEAPGENGRKGANITLPEKFYIIVMDQLNCVTGFHKHERVGIYSNEVRNMKEDELNVRYGRGQHLVKGLYTNVDVKDKIEAKGGKFAKSVYAIWIHPGKTKNDAPELELVNFKLFGSALGPWFDANIGDEANIIELSKNPEQQQNGTNLYFIPKVVVIQPTEAQQAIVALAMEKDKELQDFLNNKGAHTATMQAAGAQAETAAQQAAQPQQWEVPEGPEEGFSRPIEDISEDDDLPF